MYYELDGDVHSVELKEGDAVHSKHLKNFVKNTGTKPLVIVWMNTPPKGIQRFIDGPKGWEKASGEK